ncbi:MAG TPA: hypothetical protein VL461_13550 [Dictyobacter sp.]|jgi:hypothetical protein|nr:hypothetical protein [Dictyobacter sp.]
MADTDTTKTETQQKTADKEQFQQFVDTVASWLGETEEIPLLQIKRIVRKAEPDGVMALLKEVLDIEQNGGMLTSDQSRRRTIGGVFFFLARKKGYLPRGWFTQSKQPITQGDGNTTLAIAPFIWEDREPIIDELKQEKGIVSTVKITLIGRPGRIADRGAFIVTTMKNTKVPALPKGVPVPAQATTTYSVYISSKQWKKVAESLQNPDDVLIAEGFPYMDVKTQTVAVFVSSVATKLQQIAKREQQQAEKFE